MEVQEAKKKLGGEGAKQKERHIVSWSQQEDEILREQISIHGTENWTIIASKFKDKTTRQCRRRWYTYLNSDFKKGGWSPEEDMLLCEAQKIFGNRWTEIAKVVSGRTDNAVKNRFSTLCKKKAKHEALAKENNTSYINQNNKRALFQNGYNVEGTTETAAPLKKMRQSHASDHRKNCNHEERLLGECGTKMSQQLRPPFAVLVQNFHNVGNLTVPHQVSSSNEGSDDASQSNKIQGTFLKKDDPKITALIQQAELLTSLALKVNTENSEHSLENAWKVLQDFLNRTKESNMLGCKFSDVDFRLEDFKDLVEDLRSSNQGSLSSWRPPDLYEESPGSSEYSTGSTLLSQTTCDKPEHTQAEISAIHQDLGVGMQSVDTGEQNDGADCENVILPDGTANQVEIFLSYDEMQNNDGDVPALSNTDFSSPLQVTPLFRSLAAGIPSPKFSESERHFLLKTFGMESPSPIPCASASQPPPPPCKRALLHSL